MAKTVTAIVVCAGLLFDALAFAAPPDRSAPCGVLSSTVSREEKYRRSALCFKGIADIREEERDAERAKVRDKDKMIAAVTELAESRRSQVESEVPGWLWPTLALALAGAFAGGFLLGHSDVRSSP